MSWSELEWPDLSPAFPAPSPARPAPPWPDDLPPDIAARVRAAERRRASGVRACVLLGALLCCAAFVLFALTTPRGGSPSTTAAHPPAPALALALALLAAGLLTAFPLAALVALRLGPTWQQRQQHWRAERWRQDHARWLAVQRAVYLDSLPPERRADFSRRLLDRAWHA